jgi:thiol-disulfide isomerase/thioredoxin
MTGLIVAAGVLVAAAAFGLFRMRRDGRIHATTQPGFDFATLGVRPGRVTLLQFSSAFCAPCRATSAVLQRVASCAEGVDHVEIDAESHVDAARALHIWRTPTTLIIDAAGRVAGRASGTPNLAQVRATIGALHA